MTKATADTLETPALVGSYPRRACHVDLRPDLRNDRPQPPSVELDVEARSLELLIGNVELENRRADWKPPKPAERGYLRLYQEHVLQANEGCDLDFLRKRRRERDESGHRVGWDIDHDRASYRDHAPPSNGRSSTKEIPLPLAPRPITVPEDIYGPLGGSSPAIKDFSLLR
jgi:hypothetical protein